MNNNTKQTNFNRIGIMLANLRTEPRAGCRLVGILRLNIDRSRDRPVDHDCLFEHP